VGSETPRISVIIPCYKHAGLLPEAIESVLAQTYPYHEIVVVDDGSPDDTSAVAGQFSTYGVRCLRQANAGLAHARNAGIRATTGPYLVFLDADDRLLPSHFELSLRAFRECPQAAFVCGNFRFMGENAHAGHVHRCTPVPDHYGALLRRNFIGPPHAVMFRRDVVVRVGGFRPELKASEDYDLLLRLARRYPIYCHHEVVAEYRRYSSQMSQKWDLMLSTQLAVLRCQWQEVRGHPLYEEAYREGMQVCRDYYGEQALWRMVALARSSDYKAALRYFRVLARWYPKGLYALAAGKISRLLRRSASIFSGRGLRPQDR
jgi:glycosyltransferase involved in cell wall biosynthesis